MIRTILFDLALFCLPFALYGTYLVLLKVSARDAAAGHPHPWVALFATGLVLAICGVVFLGVKEHPPASEELYHPHWQVPKRTLPEQAPHD